MLHKLISVVFAVLPLVAADVRLSNDSPDASGYISAYTLATGIPYTDVVIQECSMARGRQNEPAVAMNPRITNRKRRPDRHVQPERACADPDELERGGLAERPDA